LPKVFSYPPLTLTLSPRWGRGDKRQEFLANARKIFPDRAVDGPVFFVTLKPDEEDFVKNYSKNLD
jgi:hypothetical protein